MDLFLISLSFQLTHIKPNGVKVSIEPKIIQDWLTSHNPNLLQRLGAAARNANTSIHHVVVERVVVSYRIRIGRSIHPQPSSTLLTITTKLRLAERQQKNCRRRDYFLFHHHHHDHKNKRHYEDEDTLISESSLESVTENPFCLS